MTIKLSTEYARLFAELGYLGISRQCFSASEKIFTMLNHMRPNEEAGVIGLALIALGENAPQKAVDHLKAAKPTPTVLTFLTVACSRLGSHREAKELAQELIDMGADDDLITIAQGAITTDLNKKEI